MQQLRLQMKNMVEIMLLSSPSAEGLLPSAYSNAKTILESRQSKIDTNNYP